MRHISVLLTVLTIGVITGACGEEEETVATEQIRAMVGQAEVRSDTAGPGQEPADTAGAEQPAADTVAGETSAGEEADPVHVELASGDTLWLRPSVAAFYRERGHTPAWTDHRGLLPRGAEMLEAIGLAYTEGLDPERYRFEPARRLAERLAADSVEERKLESLASLDVLLTEGFARLSHDLAAGTLEPGAAGLEWEIERGSADPMELLDAVIGGEAPTSVLARVRPSVAYYDRMVQGLGRLRTVADNGGWAPVPEGDALEQGDEGARVAALRARLMAGDDPDEERLARGGTDRPRTFDPALAQALEHFQTRHNLQEDGTLGPETLEALNVPVEERIETMRLNLDRWRWLPRELGKRFILVNVAGFELELVEADTALESMDVVVGKTANRTPIFRDTLEYMVVNPYWNVPRSIATEEILPKARRDPTFLARNNYEVVHDGSPVPVGNVSPSRIESGTYRIRQRPGPGNALGHVKFLFPNGYDIYLHDTPADHLFSQRTRTFSHGCIRVERPDDLARTLLTTLTDRSASDYEDLRAADGEQWVPLDEKMPVYILYFTSWVDEDGTLRFHRDVYQRDESLEAERDEAAESAGRPEPTDVAS